MSSYSSKLSALLLLFALSVKGQNEITVAISGTVYISTSRSQGIANGQTFHEAESPFKNQILYLNTDSSSMQIRTDDQGCFNAKVRTGTYNVYQEEYIKGQKRGLLNFGSEVINVMKEGDTFSIHLKNNVNGRSAIREKGVPTKPAVIKTKKN